MIEVDVQTTAFIVGTLIPILVALVTKQVASSGVKAIINALLTAIAGALNVMVVHGDHGHSGNLRLKEFVVAIGMTWTVSVATHYGLWKPTHVTGADGVVQRKVSGGVG